MKQILIIEDEIVVAKAIEQILSHNGYHVIGIATNFAKAKTMLLHLQANLILCDINLNSEKSGIDLISEIDPTYNIPFIFISAYSDIRILKEAEELGPFSYITKPFSEKQLLVTINRFFASQEKEEDVDHPTKREITILRLISRGLNTKEIADQLNLSFHTVETHRKNLMAKYKVKSMSELICLATDRKWVEYAK